MLDLSQVDLAGLAEALGHSSPEHEWWFDPATGAVEILTELMGNALGEEHPEDPGLRPVEALGSHEAYSDMVDFVACVPNVRAR